MGRLGSFGVKTSFSFTHFDSVMDGSVPAASRLFYFLLGENDCDDVTSVKNGESNTTGETAQPDCTSDICPPSSPGRPASVVVVAGGCS